MRVFVGNLNYQTSESSLRDLFAEFGEVSQVDIVSDRETGRSRGFAFVEMPNDAEAAAAIEQLNGRELDGRNLTVNEARPRNRGQRDRSPRGDRSAEA